MLMASLLEVLKKAIEIRIGLCEVFLGVGDFSINRECNF